MSATAGLGGDSPHIYLPVIRLVFVAMSLGTALGIYRLARGWGASEEAAAAGAAVWALAAPSIYFAHRAMSENAATVAAVWAVGFLLAPRASRRSLWLGASLLGLSVLFRIQMGVLVIGVLGVLAARRNWRGLLESLAVLSVWGVAYGAIDALAWSDAPGAAYGGWFHSAILYLRFTLIEGALGRVGNIAAGLLRRVHFQVDADHRGVSWRSASWPDFDTPRRCQFSPCCSSPRIRRFRTRSFVSSCRCCRSRSLRP